LAQALVRFAFDIWTTYDTREKPFVAMTLERLKKKGFFALAPNSAGNRRVKNILDRFLLIVKRLKDSYGNLKL
jgi:hypothetical protein